jgi:ribose transport system permease protein
MRKKLLSYFLFALVPIFVYLLFLVLNPQRFGSPNSLFILVEISLLPSITACGFYFIITMGLFDFSIGANIILGGIVGGTLSASLGYVGLFGGGLIVGAIVGLLNGILYTRLKIPSIIVTVGLAMIYECFGMFVAGGGILTLSPNVRLFGAFPYNIIVGFAAIAVAFFIIDYTRIGIYIRAIGNNEYAVSNMGINVDFYKVIGFLLCNLFAGMAGVLTISYSSSIAPQLGMGSLARNFAPIMGCFVGLTLKKYVNPIIAIFIGEFTISLFITGLMTNNIDATLQKVVIGVFLLAISGFASRSSKESVVK